MGNSQEQIGVIEIKFYGEDEASVEYKTDVSNEEQKEMDLIQTFALYYAKMLFNLDRGQLADSLIAYMQKAVSGIMAEGGIKRPSILASGQALIAAQGSDATKIYSGEFLENANQTRVINTQMDIGEEGYYAPLSVVMFLQWLINNLSEGSLVYFTLSLGGMNKYYREQGDYADMQSLIAAPNHGFSLAGQILSGAAGQ